MSDEKKPGLGLFINNKKGAGSSTPAAAAAVGKPKDVKKRWMYVGVATIGTVVLGSSLLAPKEPVKQAPKTVVQSTIAVEPPKADERRFENQIGDDMAKMKLQLEKLNADSAAKDKELEALKAEKAQGGKPGATGTGAPVVMPPTPNGGGLTLVGTDGGPPAPPTPPVPTSTAPTFKPPTISTTAAKGGQVPMDLPPPASSGASVNSDPMVFDAPGSANNEASGASGAKASGKNVVAKTSYRKNESAGMLPAGAFAPVVLLNGLDAGTSSATQSNPMPVLMNVLDQATLPGAAKYRLKNCFVLGTGYGDLSAERVYVRFSRLSCVDKSDRLVLSQEVSGYVVDSDGKLGLRGKVMDRQGAKLGKAMLAGFAQGLAGALGQSQSSVTSNFATGTSMSSISGTAALRASGLGGAQVATSQLAEFYLKEAQSIFPVISVDTGRTATIVFTGSAALNWGNGDSQYVQEVKPTN
jgi:conjugal transfer pilus assembly protein TraB